MTYTGEMVLPNGAVQMQEEEMCYCEGGAKASLNMLYKNVKGLISYIPSKITYQLGIQGFVGQILKHSLTWAYSFIAAKFGLLAAKVGGWVAGVIAVAGAVGCGYYLATHRKFY